MGPHLSVCHQRSPVVSGVGSSLLQGPVWSGPLRSGAPKQSSTRLVAPFNVGERGGPGEDARPRPAPLQGQLVTGLSSAGGKGWGRVRRCHSDRAPLPNSFPTGVRTNTWFHFQSQEGVDPDRPGALPTRLSRPRALGGLADTPVSQMRAARAHRADLLRSCVRTFLLVSLEQPRTDPFRPSQAEVGLFQVSKGRVWLEASPGPAVLSLPP